MGGISLNMANSTYNSDDFWRQWCDTPSEKDETVNPQTANTETYSSSKPDVTSSDLVSIGLGIDFPLSTDASLSSFTSDQLNGITTTESDIETILDPLPGFTLNDLEGHVNQHDYRIPFVGATDPLFPDWNYDFSLFSATPTELLADDPVPVAQLDTLNFDTFDVNSHCVESAGATPYGAKAHDNQGACNARWDELQSIITQLRTDVERQREFCQATESWCRSLSQEMECMQTSKTAKPLRKKVG